MLLAWKRWAWAAIGLIAIAALGAIVWNRPQRVTATTARRALGAGRFADAATAVENWLRIEPRSAEAHYFKARVALALDRPASEIESSFRQAKELGYPDSELSLVSALVNAKLGRHTEAEPALRRAYDEGGPDPQVDEALARIYLETFDFHRASPVLARWAREAPRDPKPYLWRVEVDRRSDTSSDEVIAGDYREALARDPDLAKARLGLAQSLRALHRNDDARREFTRYIALSPNDATGHLGAGQNARELGDDETAANHFHHALALDPKNAVAHKELADLAAKKGELNDAVAHLDRAIALDPFEVENYYSRALVLARLGRAKDAERDQAAAKRLRDELEQLNALKGRLLVTPNQADIEIQIAQWMFDHGRDDDGARWAEKVLQAQPDHPRANRLLADYHTRQGRAGRANYYRMQASGKP